MKRLAITLTLCLTACASKPKPYVRTAPFVVDEYAQYSGEGDAAIEGQAFVKTAGGDVKPCAGNNVILNPVTSYSAEWFEHAIVKGETVTSPDPRVKDYARKVMGDADGRFVFEKLPPGSYYVTCLITWKVPEVVWTPFGMTTVLSDTGGQAYAQVTVTAGERAKVIATRR